MSMFSFKKLNSFTDKAKLNAFIDKTLFDQFVKVCPKSDWEQFVSNKNADSFPLKFDYDLNQFVDIMQDQGARQQLSALSTRLDRHLNQLSQYPEVEPVDWEKYEKELPVPGIVNLQKKVFERIEIPSINESFIAFWKRYFSALEGKIDAEAKLVEDQVENARLKYVEHDANIQKRLTQSLKEVAEEFPDLAQEVYDEIKREEWITEADERSISSSSS